MNRDELKLIQNTLEEALRTDDGSRHHLPEKYRSDLQKCINFVKRELGEECPKGSEGARTFSLYCGARNSYLAGERDDLTWECAEFRKKHPSIKAASRWVPPDRKDPEWEMAVHEFHGDVLVAKHTI